MSTTHNPVNFNPADYEVIGCFDNKPPQFFVDNLHLGPTQEEWAAHKAYVLQWEAEGRRLFPKENYRRCQHCGQSNVRWVVCAEHKPTGDRVCFGDDCQQRLGLENRLAYQMQRLREKAAGGLGRMKVMAAFEEWKQTEDACEFLPDLAKFQASTNPFIQDVLAKLNQYGSLSEAQTSAVSRAYHRDVERAAQKATEPAPTAPAPVGRCEVEGEIIATKAQESAYGITWKMLVRLNTGAKIWCSLPMALIPDQSKGLQVKFKATFERSEKDEFFAFGKRPILISSTKTPA